MGVGGRELVGEFVDTGGEVAAMLVWLLGEDGGGAEEVTGELVGVVGVEVEADAGARRGGHV